MASSADQRDASTAVHAAHCAGGPAASKESDKLSGLRAPAPTNLNAQHDKPAAATGGKFRYTKIRWMVYAVSFWNVSRLRMTSGQCQNHSRHRRFFFFFFSARLFPQPVIAGVGVGREGPHRRGGTRLAGGGRSQRPSARTSCSSGAASSPLLSPARGSSSKEDANARWAATARSAAHRATQAV